MADFADIAADATAAALSARLARVDAAIPAGVAGECDDCGEMMPRLVDGLCGFCRDGRRPPLATYDRLKSVVPTAVEETKMANPKPTQDYRQISVPARGAPLIAIQKYATERDLPLGQAVLGIVEEWLAGGVVTVGSDTANVADITVEELLGELARRLNPADREELAEMVARAVAAETRLAEANARAAAVEAKLAAVTAVLGGAPA